ncbi:MAG: PP2C family protein-serine/threonine phosphatase [Eggerthellaceae bacterium]|nr:PP2C family protein-serine/threonine phosphatase [Eggerthellaceae bacterium]
MFKKVQGQKKPRSRMLRQNRVTLVYLIALQLISLVVGVVLFVGHASNEVQQTTAIHAEMCAVVAYDEGGASFVNQVMQLHQEAKEKTGDPMAGIDADAAAAIQQDQAYQNMIARMNAVYTEDVFEMALIGYDEENQTAVLVAASSGDESDLTEIGAVEEIPEEFLKRSLSGDFEKYTDYTILTGSSRFLAVYACYLVPGDPSSGIMYAVGTDSRIIRSVIMFITQYLAITFILIMIIMFRLNRRTMRLLVQPTEAITNAIDEYSRNRSEGKQEGNHFSNLDVKTDNELENLAETLARMEHNEILYVDKIAQATAEREREEAELLMAARIQESALPRVFPAFPDRPEFEIYASMSPAREVGGDFYDFFLVDDDHLCMVIADVSDKGIPAALFMMTSKTTIANHVRMGKSPAEALDAANKAICESNDTGMFVTVWVAILEISTGQLTASNAAHEYPVVQRPNGAFSLYRDRHAVMVGVLEEAQYSDYKMVLRPGSKLFVYTDGVPEATNADEDMFGLDRMVDALNEHKDATPEQVLTNMRRSVDAFVKDAPQFDDLTMLCLEYRGANRS